MCGTPSVTVNLFCCCAVCIIIYQHINSLLLYNHQTLMGLQPCAKNRVISEHDGQKMVPPFLPRNPAYLCRASAPPLWKKHSCCLWDECSCLLLRMMTCLECYSEASQTMLKGVLRLFILKRSLHLVHIWLASVVDPIKVHQRNSPCSPRPCWGGVSMHNLQPLCCIPQTPIAVNTPASAMTGLITFTLQDFFSSRVLDHLYVSESWLSVDESSSFIELVPQNCCYFNRLTSGWRGGTTHFNKGNCKCNELYLYLFNSFDVVVAANSSKHVLQVLLFILCWCQPLS